MVLDTAGVSSPSPPPPLLPSSHHLVSAGESDVTRVPHFHFFPPSCEQQQRRTNEPQISHAHTQNISFLYYLFIYLFIFFGMRDERRKTKLLASRFPDCSCCSAAFGPAGGDGTRIPVPWWCWLYHVWPRSKRSRPSPQFSIFTPATLTQVTCVNVP